MPESTPVAPQPPTEPLLLAEQEPAISPDVGLGNQERTAIVELVAESLGRSSSDRLGSLRSALRYSARVAIETTDHYCDLAEPDPNPVVLDQMAHDLQLGVDALKAACGRVLAARETAPPTLGRLDRPNHEPAVEHRELTPELNWRIHKLLVRAYKTEQKAEIEQLLLLEGKTEIIQGILGNSEVFDDLQRKLIERLYFDPTAERPKNQQQLLVSLAGPKKPYQISVIKNRTLASLHQLYQQTTQSKIRDRLVLLELEAHDKQLPPPARHQLTLARRRRSAAISERLVLGQHWGRVWPEGLQSLLRSHLDDYSFAVLDHFYGLTKVTDQIFDIKLVTAALPGHKSSEAIHRVKLQALADFHNQVVAHSDDLGGIVVLIDRACENLPAPEISAEIRANQAGLPPLGGVQTPL